MTTAANDGIRWCPVCRQADDHPRHQIAGTIDSVAPHMDCCAQVGCPDGSCDIVTRNKGRKTGASFRALIADEDAETKQLLEKRPIAVSRFYLDGVDQTVHGGLAAGGTPTDLQGVQP